MKDKILDAFGKPMLSIDIGSQNIKIVEGKYAAGKVSISKAVTVPTPPETFYNGEIIDRARVELAINETLKKESIRAKNVAFTLESTEAISREIVLPWAKPQELGQIIRFEAEQYLPIEMEKYILQYKIMSEFEEEGTKKVTVLVVALPKVMGEDYLDLGRNTGLTPHYLDIHSNSIHKLLHPKAVVNDSYPLEEQTIAAIDLGHQFINITIIDKGLFKFSRLLKRGGKDIDVNISNLFTVSLEEAKSRKREIKDISQDTEQIDPSSSTSIVKETITGWLEDIQKVFRYHTSRSTDNVIDSICIYGGSSNIEGISTYIQKFFNTPTFKINGLNNVKFDNNSKEISISNYINAIGSIIRR